MVMNEFVNKAKKLWGSNESRGFKLGAWGVAFGAAAVWFYVDTYVLKKELTPQKSIEGKK